MSILRSNYMICASLIEDLEYCECRDLLEEYLEFKVMKLFVSDVSTLFSSVLSPLSFVANDMSEGIASTSKRMS